LPLVVQDGTYSYVYGLDLIAAIDGSSNEIYYLDDGLGSVAELTDDSGVVTDSYVYDVFGAVTSSTGSTANDWLFTGEQEDGETGLYFLRARYYDPETGRFLARDPLEFNQRYAYAGNNPATMVDPSGLEWEPSADTCYAVAYAGLSPEWQEYKNRRDNLTSSYWLGWGAGCEAKRYDDEPAPAQEFIEDPLNQVNLAESALTWSCLATAVTCPAVPYGVVAAEIAKIRILRDRVEAGEMTECEFGVWAVTGLIPTGGLEYKIAKKVSPLVGRSWFCQ